MLFAIVGMMHDGDGHRSAGHLPRARDPVAGGLRADRHPARSARRAPKRRSSISCSARSPARSSSTASRSPTASPAARGSTAVGVVSVGAVDERQPDDPARARACCWSASRSRSPRCRSTCGRRTPTKARRRSSPASCPPASRRRRSRRSCACSSPRFEPFKADWAPVLWRDRGRDDDPRHGRRRGADQPEAHARVLEHRARRLPAGRPRRRQRRRQGARSCSTCSPTR